MSVPRLAAATATLALAIAGHATAAFTARGANEVNTARAATVFKPRAAASPTITGTAGQNQTLIGHDGVWDRQPATHARTWLRCAGDGASCAAIPGATDATYRPAPDDVGHRLRYRVTAGNAGGQTVATSSATERVPAIQNDSPPQNTATPAMTGDTVAGATLTARPGGWTGVQNVYGYEWLRCSSPDACSTIPDATATTYAIADADLGTRLRVRVTATNDGGSREATSAPTAVVTAANLVAPAVSGTAREEWTLTSTAGTWRPANAPVTHAWLRCDAAGASCTTIAGEDAPWYVPQAADVGTTIRSQVTATVNGAGLTARSAPSAVIAGLARTPSGSLPDAFANGFHLGFSSLKFGVEGAMPGSGAARFAGSGAHARRNSPPSPFNIGAGELTVQAWVRVPRTPKLDGVPIVQRYECGYTCQPVGGASAIWNLDVLSTGRARWQVRDDQDRSPSVVGSSDLRDSRWHLVTAVLSRATSPATMRIFVDGQVEGTLSTPLGSVTDDQGSAVTVGCYTAAASGSACDLTSTGRLALDDVALYRSALSTERVAAHWQARSSAADFRAAAQVDGAFVFWPMDGPA